MQIITKFIRPSSWVDNFTRLAQVLQVIEGTLPDSTDSPTSWFETSPTHC
jgi:hypothetical protein